MKSLLLTAAVAALAFTGCATEDTPVGPTPPQGIPVNFSTEITEISRSAPVTAFIDTNEIGVFGTEALVATPEVPTSGWMDNMKLTRASGVWSAAASKFFVYGYKYTFAAYAPYMTGANDPTAISYTASKTLSEQQDVMYADVIDKDFSATVPATADAQVKFNFHHALVQLKFSAKTAADYSAYYTVKVTKVQVVDILSTATLNCKTGVWSTPTAKLTYEQTVDNKELNSTGFTQLESAGDDVLMLIPQNPNGCKVVMSVTAVNKADAKVTKTTDIEVAFPDEAWVMNNVYRYKVTLNLNAILGFENAVFQEPDIAAWGTEIPKEI